VQLKPPLIVAACVVTLCTATAAQAAEPEIGQKFEIVAHRDLLAQRDVSSHALRDGVDELARPADRADRKQRTAAHPDFSLAGGVSQATLDAIAACESGGDPTAVSSDGSYRGKYQFDYGTWESMGGSGDPAAAPEAEQDYRAAMLYAASGSSPWPVCG
jgi:soluble lytic murein transglycosylase-like protein